MNKKLTVKIIFVWIFVVVITAGYFLMIPKSLGPEYRNAEYGFSVALPKSWSGYTVSINKWTGYASGDQLGEKAFAEGSVVSIHNPKWRGLNTYQDIPVIIFTLDQWKLLQEDKFHIGAAPIGPSELGRNTKYVFALPARYNFSFPPGYEEVDEIIQSKPLRIF